MTAAVIPVTKSAAAEQMHNNIRASDRWQEAAAAAVAATALASAVVPQACCLCQALCSAGWHAVRLHEAQHLHFGSCTRVCCCECPFFRGSSSCMVRFSAKARDQQRSAAHAVRQNLCNMLSCKSRCVTATASRTLALHLKSRRRRLRSTAVNLGGQFVV